MGETKVRIVQQFKKVDGGGVGKMRRDTVERVLVGVGQSQQDAEGLLAVYSPSDTIIDYVDFVDWLLGASAPPRSKKEAVQRIFEECDLQRSGKIAKSTLMQAVQQISAESCWQDLQTVYASCMGSDEDQVDYKAFLDALFADDEMLDVLSYYASPKRDFGTVLRQLDPAAEDAAPLYATMDDFREAHAGNEPLLKQMRNRVLVCAKCKKPNAYTLKDCNACGSSLAAVEETFNDNIFMGFIYGVAKGRFPYAVSTRAETEDYLAFDDPLGVTAVHLCVIPTSVFCPDIRFLFTDPARGLKIVDDMMEIGRQAVLASYWSDKAFIDTYWPGEEPPKTVEDMVNLCVLGFNFPPSMFQLHLQFQHRPLFPFHTVQLEKGNHYNHGRFYPFEYVRAALALGDAVRMEVHDETPIEDVVAKVKDQGLDYDAMHAQMIAKGKIFAARFPIWRKGDFEYTVTEGKVYSNETGELVPDLDPAELQKKDNVAMRNYAKPKCSLYRYMKSRSGVQHFVEGA